MLEEEHGQYWKTLVHAMLDGVMVVDSDGVIVSINNSLEKLTGYSKDELIGQSCEIFNCDNCLETRERGGGRHCELFKEGQVRHSKCVLQRKDGTPLHVLKNAAILKDNDGLIVGGVETLTDCTELVAKERVISSLRRELSIEDSFHGIIGKSAVMCQVFDLIRSAAQSEVSVTIYGDSGTGKELVASVIHHLSQRSNNPYVKVSCAALNESLLESELFGHVKGAFTGADRTRVGRFEAASGGVIFLDEIGDLSLSTQVKLLRVLQEKEIEKVGDHRPIPIDVRVLTATNKDLNKLMEEGRFRKDLYYRIGIIPIYLPSLRERREDIPLLIDAFINRIRLKTGKNISGVDKKALELLYSYDWPGNVRELINAIEYAFVLCSEGVIMYNHLPASIKKKPQHTLVERPKTSRQKGADEREHLLATLERTGGNKSEAARILDISRVTLWKRLKAHNIQVGKKIQG